VEPPSAAAEAAFDAVAAAMIADANVKRAPAFGMPGLRRGGKVFAGLFGDAMVFKLGAGSPEHAEAMALAGAQLWDPSDRDRPFRDWVEVPFEHAGRWPELASQAVAKAPGK